MKERLKLKVISIEGIDGTGKTVLLEGLRDKLNNKDHCFVNFPTKMFYEKYRELDKDKYREEEYFEEVNRLQTEDKEFFYEYWKQNGKKIMFCDRYDVTQKVYDGSSLGKQTIDLDVKSDLVIYLSADMETILNRIDERGEEDCLGYEEEERLKELEKRYERILEEEYQGKYKVIEIGSEDTIEDVLYLVLNYLHENDVLENI